MATGRTLQFSFTAGEFSPRLLGRHDLQQYQDALKTMKNFTPLVHGGAKARVGTRFVDEIRDSSLEFRMLPYVFSETIARVVVLNDGFIQFVADGAFLLDGASRVELAHPYSESELAEITFTQNGNTMFLFHDAHVPKQLQRTSDTVWTLTDVLFSWNAVTDFRFTSGYLDFHIIRSTTAFDIGDVFTIDTDGAGAVTGTTSPGGAKGTIEEISIDATLDAGGPYTYTITALTNEDTTQIQDWGIVRDDGVIPIAQFTPTSQPVTGTFFEQRLWLGGPPDAPQTLWGSRIGDFTDLTLGPKNDDGVQFTIASNTLNQVKHLVSARSLIALTTGEEFTVSGTQDSGITATGVRIRTNTSHGISDTDPIKIGGEVIFTQKGGRRVRAISYEALTDSNTAPDISILAEHITGLDGVTEMAFAEEPDFIAWIIANDGRLLSLTLLRQQEVVAWAQHDSPGASGLFEHVAVIPEGTVDQTYFGICRIIDGSPVRYIEYLDYETTITASVLGLTTDSTVEGVAASHLEVWNAITGPVGGSGFSSQSGVRFIFDGSTLPNASTTGLQFQSGSSLARTMNDNFHSGIGLAANSLTFGPAAEVVPWSFDGSVLAGSSSMNFPDPSRTWEWAMDLYASTGLAEERFKMEIHASSASTLDAFIAELNAQSTGKVNWSFTNSFSGSAVAAITGSAIAPWTQSKVVNAPLKDFVSVASTGIPDDGTSYNFRVISDVGTSGSALYDVILPASSLGTFDSFLDQLNAATTPLASGLSGLHWAFSGVNDIRFSVTPGPAASVLFLPSASTYRGLDHLIGASVDIVADGATHPRRVVSASGTVSLQTPASNVIVGLPFTPELELLHPEPFQGDSTRVQQFRPRYINLLVQDTIGADVVFQDADGNEKRTETIPARRFGDLMDSPVPPLTDTIRVAGQGWETPFNLVIRQNVPMPITVLSVIMQFQVDDN
jgi:hypothetical protein